MVRTSRLVAVGLTAGLLSGMFGVGGGILIVPGLMWVASMEQRRAALVAVLRKVVRDRGAIDGLHEEGLAVIIAWVMASVAAGVMVLAVVLATGARAERIGQSFSRGMDSVTAGYSPMVNMLALPASL